MPQPFIDNRLWPLLSQRIRIPAYTADAWQAWLRPAIEYPDTPKAWGTNSTWNAVRAVVQWHAVQDRTLRLWGWPTVQAAWTAQGGPTWDPWALALVAGAIDSTTAVAEFDTPHVLHHPLEPGLALWAWAALPHVTHWPDLTGLAPLLALDAVLRSLVSPSPRPAHPHFWSAWAAWVQDPPPHPADAAPAWYPAALFTTWTQALAAAEAPITGTPAAMPAARQLSWW